MSGATLDQGSALATVAEELLGAARAVGPRIGLSPNAAAITVLITAVSAAGAMIAGPEADEERLAKIIKGAQEQIAQGIRTYHRQVAERPAND